MSFVHNSHAHSTYTYNAHTQHPSTSQSLPVYPQHSTPLNTFTPQRANLPHQSHSTHPSAPTQQSPKSLPHQPQHSQEAPSATEINPPTSPLPKINLLPQFSAPKSATEWAQMDEHLRVQVVPRVLQADNIDIMNSLLCRGIQDYLMANHPPCKKQSHRRNGQSGESHHRALTAVRKEKNAVKRELRALRRKSDDPEEVRLLAVKFHKLVRQHCRLVKEQKRKEWTRTMHQQRRHCHRNF